MDRGVLWRRFRCVQFELHTEQFCTMPFAQLAYHESLCDIEIC